jgi:hypothetical protein
MVNKRLTVYPVLIAVAILVGCSGDRLVDEPTLSEQEILEILYSSEMEVITATLHEAEGLIREVYTSDRSLIDDLRTSILDGDDRTFAQILGIEYGLVESWGSRMIVARQSLHERYPRLGRASKDKANTCITTQDDYEGFVDSWLAGLMLPTGVHGFHSVAEATGAYAGCKKLALAACTAGCGLSTPGVVLALVCGYACYCGFCDGDRGGVCV